MLYPALRWYLCALAALALVQSSARAVVLDWDLVSWNPGDVTNSYQVDPADPDSNISITIDSNNGAPLVPYSGDGTPTPAIKTAFQGGLPTTENSLVMAVNLSDPSQSITVTLSFSAGGGASDVSFKLFDIDAGGGVQDQLSGIRALSIDGVTLIAPTITISANNTLIGTGINQTVVGTATTSDTGPLSGRANVTIDFGTNLIQSLTFTYGSTAAFPDPAYQHFGLHDINFTPVPEINPTVISVIVCLAASGVALRHRVRFRK